MVVLSTTQLLPCQPRGSRQLPTHLWHSSMRDEPAELRGLGQDWPLLLPVGQPALGTAREESASACWGHHCSYPQPENAPSRSSPWTALRCTSTHSSGETLPALHFNPKVCRLLFRHKYTSIAEAM